MTTVSNQTSEGLAVALAARVGGEVYAPGDPGYDEARAGFNLVVDQHPAVIVVPRSADDVAEAVRFARGAGLGVSVKATGHGTVRPADGALMIVTREMRGVEVDPGARTAWVEAGTRWGAVLAKAQEHGLAPLLGSSPGVGAVGYTLGGGLGWLARQYGLAADSVRRFEVVTANGERLTASADENPALFWGLKGGGGSLAIVTGMEIELFPVDTVYAGNLFYPAEDAPEVFRRYREWIADAPDALSSGVVLMNFPPVPQVPEPLRGQSFVIVRGCYCGSLEEGQALVDEWRAWKAPAMDLFGPMPFAESAAISSDPEEPMPSYSSGGWLADLSDEVIDAVIAHAAPGSPLVMVELRHIGGAVSRPGPDAAAYSHRDAELILHGVGMTPTPEAYHAAARHVAGLMQALGGHTAGVYPNFLEGEEAQARIREGYSEEAYRRLAALKARYDPENVLSYSFNVQPAAEAAG